MKKWMSLMTAMLLVLSVMTTAFASEGAPFEPLAKGAKDTRTSTRVADMQKKLIDYGYLTSKADGNFGPKTQSALIAFQQANGLTPDGVYGDDDDAKLNSGNVTRRVRTTATSTSTSSRTASSSRSSSRNTNTPDNTRNTPDNTRNTPDNTRNTPDNT